MMTERANITIAPNTLLHISFRLAYLELTLTSKNQLDCKNGVVPNIVAFLLSLVNDQQLLSQDVRHGYLAKIAELLNIDNSRNWRFREELAW